MFDLSDALVILDVVALVAIVAICASGIIGGSFSDRNGKR